MSPSSCLLTGLLPGAAFAAACALVGGYALSLYGVTLTGAVPIGVTTPPLAPGLRSQPAAIYVHAFASGSALILCGLQMLPIFRRYTSAATHRLLGWAYVFFVALGSISAAFLSRTAVGGITSTIGFGTLALLWVASTAGAVLARRTGRLALHARLAAHSAALAFSAVTLRLYLPAAILSSNFDVTYSALSWLCWVPNVLAVEAWCLRQGGGLDTALLSTLPGSAAAVAARGTSTAESCESAEATS
jgi:uncharacterized membrane protein